MPRGKKKTSWAKKQTGPVVCPYCKLTKPARGINGHQVACKRYLEYKKTAQEIRRAEQSRKDQQIGGDEVAMEAGNFTPGPEPLLNVDGKSSQKAVSAVL